MSGVPILEILDLHAAYGRIEVLRGVDLTVPTGAVMAVNQLGGIVGTVGGGCGEHEILKHALEALRSGKPRLIELDMSNDVAEEEGMVCGGRMRVWIEPFAPQ